MTTGLATAGVDPLETSSSISASNVLIMESFVDDLKDRVDDSEGLSLTASDSKALSEKKGQICQMQVYKFEQQQQPNSTDP